MAGRYVFPDHIDLAATTMLLGAAINYLAARSRKIRVMSGVATASDDDWQRLSAAIDQIVDGLFALS